jgi:hypothetical protein
MVFVLLEGKKGRITAHIPQLTQLVSPTLDHFVSPHLEFTQPSSSEKLDVHTPDWLPALGYGPHPGCTQDTHTRRLKKYVPVVLHTEQRLKIIEHM